MLLHLIVMVASFVTFVGALQAVLLFFLAKIVCMDSWIINRMRNGLDFWDWAVAAAPRSLLLVSGWFAILLFGLLVLVYLIVGHLMRGLGFFEGFSIVLHASGPISLWIYRSSGMVSVFLLFFLVTKFVIRLCDRYYTLQRKKKQLIVILVGVLSALEYFVFIRFFSCVNCV